MIHSSELHLTRTIYCLLIFKTIFNFDVVCFSVSGKSRRVCVWIVALLVPIVILSCLGTLAWLVYDGRARSAGYEQDIAALNASLNASDALYQALLEQNKALLEQNKALFEQNKLISARLDASEDNISRLSSELEQRAAVDNCTRKVECEEIGYLVGSIEALNTSQSEMNMRLWDELSGIKLEFHTAIENLNSSFKHELDELSYDLKDEVAALVNTLDRLNGSLWTQLQQELDLVRFELDKAALALARELNESIGQFQQVIDELKVETRADLQTVEENLTIQLVEVTEELKSKLSETNYNWNSAVKALNETSAKLQQVVEDLISEVEESTYELQTDIDSLSMNLSAQFMQEIDSLRNEVNETVQQITSEISFVNESLIAYVNQQISDLDTKINDSKTELREETHFLIEALNQSQTLADAQLQYSIDAKTAQLSLEVNNTRALIQSTASEIRDETAGEVRSLQAYINDTADHLKTELEGEIRDTADDLQEIITAHNESHISQGISGLRAEIDSEIDMLNTTVVHQYQQTWFAIDVLNQTQISTKTEILSAIDARTTELSEDVENLKSQVDSTATEIRSELHDSIGQLQTSITGVKTELETDIQGVSDDLKATKGTLSNDITQLRSNINEIKTDITDIKSDVTDLKTSDCSRYRQCNPGSNEPDDAFMSTASTQLLLLFVVITVFCF